MTAIILTHNGAAEIHQRHERHWRESFENLVTISPWDDYYPGSIPMGKSEKRGLCSIERMMLATILASRFPSAAIIEYDTLILRPPGNVPEGMLYCSKAMSSDDEAFKAPIYGHSPWMATGETWWKIALAGSGLEHGFPDRWLANAAHNAKVPIYGIEGGFSEDKWTTDTDAAAIRAKGEGAWCFHGVKDEVMYRSISGSAIEESIRRVEGEFTSKQSRHFPT